MTSGLTSLLADPRLHRAASLKSFAPEKREASLPVFEGGRLHEFFLETDLPAATQPCALLTLLAARQLQATGGDSASVASRPRRDLRIVYVGKSCWPSFQLVAAAMAPSPLGNALFLDPVSDAEKFWAIGQALRCGSIGAVIADGSHLTATISRRLQLAAESLGGGERGPVAFLARPVNEKEQASWAASRWSVRPVACDGQNPQWLLECFSCRRQHAGQDAPRRWIAEGSYQVLRGTVTFHLSADVGHRVAAAPGALEPGRRVRTG